LDIEAVESAEVDITAGVTDGCATCFALKDPVGMGFTGVNLRDELEHWGWYWSSCRAEGWTGGFGTTTVDSDVGLAL
jgi:hypothetical protein